MLWSRSASLTRMMLNILDHGQQHLPQVFGLFILVGPHRQLADLGLALDDAPNLLHTEAQFDLVESDLGILDRVVQQTCDQGVAVETAYRRAAPVTATGWVMKGSPERLLMPR